jgi:2-desacetyl-2-hydroxyethyl bacteriochlorophyllide A dehydrogenase
MSAAKALWYAAPRRAELREVSLSMPNGEQALIATSWSGISRGTERLIFEGRVPASEFNSMRAPLQDGTFPFPVKYGYCAVGTVKEGPTDLKGRTVFSLHPHQDKFVAPIGLMVPVPDAVPARRAILSANMETALNALWDSGIVPGSRVAIVGAGIVGLLVGYLAARIPKCDVTVVDVATERKQIAESLGLKFASPDTAPRDVNLVFHTSASAAGLTTAIGLAGFEAKIIEMSWYGEGTVAVPLGGAFHSRRLQLISSQVGHVAPSHRAEWTHRQRLAKAVELLADQRLDALITEEIAFESLPDALPRILVPGAPGLATAIRYV